MSQANIISVSGGKDSTATALLAIERDVPNRYYVFADTGNEHEKTHDYLDYLERELSITIHRVKADFSQEIARKRMFIARDCRVGRQKKKVNGKKKSGKKIRWSTKSKRRALGVLHPTGVPFIDLCLWKGRFPSTRRRFCSEELKHKPLDKFTSTLLAEYDEVVSWQGVRRDESPSRAVLDEEEDHPTIQGLVWYRPILDWKAEECFSIAKRHGLEPNPLYKEGMGRVGCMPCIHATKSETFEISMRFPEELDRLAQWERLVSIASKQEVSTFFDARTVQRHLGLPPITSQNAYQVSPATHGVSQYVEWSKTARGGRQYDLIKSIEIEDVAEGSTCKSLYGLCE